MKDVTNAKGLGDLRTATTHHIAAKPPRQGTMHLDLYLLSMEKQRLEKELSRLEQRQKRIYERLGEVRRAMEKKENKAQTEKAAQNYSAMLGVDSQLAANEQHGEREWKKMTFNY